MSEKVPILSTELYKRLYEALLCCEEFDSHQCVCEFIAKGELAVYHSWFLRIACATKEERIKKTINYLRGQGIRLALPLFLLALCDTLLEGDMLLNELHELTSAVELELKAYPSLDPNEREYIIHIVDIVITPMGIDGRKNLLRLCLTNDIIGRIRYDDATRNVAEAMVGRVEDRDRLNSSVCFLEIFLDTIVKRDPSIDPQARSRLANIVTTYKQRKVRAFNNALDEESDIAQRLQKAREHNRTKSVPSQYKIDASTIIQCNLHEQKANFWQEIRKRYKGAFTFSVASIDREILKEYVIESLLWELKQRIRRPTAPVRHVYLSLENLGCSSLEQGVISLQKEIEQQLSIQSITDLLSEDQETNVVIVIWHKDIPLDRLRLIALQFSETLNEGVKDILHQQGRCLVLFWATYGFSSIESLDVPLVLPIFERFEIDHLSEWLEYEVSTQLRGQNIPEQEIRYCWERIVTKIKHFEGRLPETYEVLRESLELGGIL